MGYGGAPSAPIDPYDWDRSKVGSLGGFSTGVDYNRYDQNRPRGIGNNWPPSAPVEYTPFDWNEQRGSVRHGEGLAGAMGGMTLEEGVRREREGESDVWSRDGYSDTRGRYGYN